MKKPKAFMSYAHRDDADQGLTRMLERLSNEVGIVTGTDFRIFKDKGDIEWGQDWEQRIKESLDEVTFLIPVLTPSFFNSDFCRTEVQLFLNHERELGRNDLILPLYYVESDLWEDEARRRDDELVQILRKHQFVDWRELRGRTFEAEEVGGELRRLARYINKALGRVQGKRENVKNTPKAGASSTRRSPTGTYLRSVPKENDPSPHATKEQRLILVDLRLIDSHMRVIKDNRDQGLYFANNDLYEEAIEQFDLAVSIGLNALRALKRERTKESNEHQEDENIEEAE